MDYEGQWQKVGTSKAVAVASKVHQETFRSNRAFALCKFAGWPVYATLGLETSSSSGLFFQDHQEGLGTVDPIFDGLEQCGHRKTQLSYPCQAGAVTRRAEALKATTISIVEQVTSQSRWTPRLFLLKKKKFEVTTEKKKGKERKRENE